MTALGWAIEEDPFVERTPYGPKNFNNIIAIQNPAAPYRFTLACHFDSKYFAEFDFIGATDSAVPCAMMIELAYALNDTLGPPSENSEVSLQFIFFDGEEAFVDWTSTDSIYGARHLASRMASSDTKQLSRELYMNDLGRMSVLVLLDLIGTSTTRFHSWFDDTHHLFERLKKIEQQLARDGMLYKTSSQHWQTNRYFVGGLQRYGGIQDDHIPFLHKQAKVLHLISYPFPREWHTERDDMRALDFDAIDDISAILRVFVTECLHV